MPKIRKNKIVLFLCSFGALMAIGIFLFSLERRYCVGVPVVSENALEGYTETKELDISQLLFEKETIAVDWPRNQVYISQSKESLKNFFTMQGVLESVPSAYCAFEVKEDKTATLSTVDEKGRVMNEQLAWEYKETTEGGMYVFDVTNTSGGVLTTVYSPEGNRVVMFTSETTSILFEKVGE